MSGDAEALRRHPWDESYPTDVNWYHEIGGHPVYALLDDAVARFPNHVFLDFLDRTWTYAEAGEITDRVARGLQDLGVKPGVKVGLFLPNCPYFVFAYFAALKAGGTVVAFNPLLSVPEVARQVRDSDSEIMVTLDLKRLFDKVKAALPGTKVRQVVVCPMADLLPFPKSLLFRLFKWKERARVPFARRYVRFARLTANDGEFAPTEIKPSEDIAAILYTGGTTGDPRGVCLTHANLYVNCVQTRAFLGFVEKGGERVLALMPFFHAFGMTAVMNTSILLNAELILMPRFDVAELLQTIQDKKVTLFVGVPTVYAAMLNHPTFADYDLSSLKLCNAGGDALPVELKGVFEEWAGCRLIEGYGLTEAGPVVATNPPTGTDKPGSVGLPMQQTVVEIISVDDGGRPVPAGETGEICVTGPQVMAGYWQHPDETARALLGGRLHTGDIGYLDADGYLYIVDRLKDVIITGGYNVYPRVVEDAILAHESVAEVAAVGVPDVHWGHAVVAFVVPGEGRHPTEAELLAFAKESLASYETPKRVILRESLPKSAIGKVLKRALVEDALAAAAR